MKQTIAWNVLLDGKEIDTVFFDCDIDGEQVKRSLVEHDGYDSRIEVVNADER